MCSPLASKPLRNYTKFHKMAFAFADVGSLPFIFPAPNLLPPHGCYAPQIWLLIEC